MLLTAKCAGVPTPDAWHTRGVRGRGRSEVQPRVRCISSTTSFGPVPGVRVRSFLRRGQTFERTRTLPPLLVSCTVPAVGHVFTVLWLLSSALLVSKLGLIWDDQHGDGRLSHSDYHHGRGTPPCYRVPAPHLAGEAWNVLGCGWGAVLHVPDGVSVDKHGQTRAHRYCRPMSSLRCAL